jgi:hypothetical protein
MNNTKEVIYYNPGALFISDNILHNSLNKRNEKMNHTIINANDNESYILNIYVREKDINGNKMKSQNIEGIVLVEDYRYTFEKILCKFEKNEITKEWKGLDSFKYVFRGDFDFFKECIQQFINIRKNNKICIELIDETDKVIDNSVNDIETTLNIHNLNKNYIFDEYRPVIVEKVLTDDTLILLKEYYKKTIENNVFKLGDRQSKRYKSHNDLMSRILHYEILPLIENIVGKPLIPTYTYLSSYIEGSDLPAHTDRADCEYTVSFLINKPKGLSWPIYFHKIKQPIKHKGRSDFIPPKNECIKVDCNTGGLMIFQGTENRSGEYIIPNSVYLPEVLEKSC